MCKLIINKINLYASCIHFKLKFDDGLTLISGNSGIGKSLLYKALRFKSAEDDRIKCYDAIDLLKTDIIKEIKGMSNKVVVIDNGDVALSMEQRAEIIFDNKNQYIIMSQHSDGYCPGERSLRTLVIKDNIAKLVPEI